ncbi:sugar transferase, partial [Cutibacterium acnes]
MDNVESIVDQRALFDNVSHLYLIIKRLTDICVALFGFIILSPVFLVTALLVKLTSPGKIIFAQDRNGYRGKMFK